MATPTYMALVCLAPSRESQRLTKVGIRIGYYSAAISLWISNLWAPAEIIFLWPITMTFLVAVLVGVCVLASETKTTYSIEPFMMMQIAYYVRHLDHLFRNTFSDRFRLTT